MTIQEVRRKAAALGSYHMAKRLGVEEVVVSRWLSGAMDAELDKAATEYFSQ